METDVTVVWSKVTHGLALETEPQKIEYAKQGLLKIIEENKNMEPAKRMDNENYFARDLMEWVKDRGAEDEVEKAKYIFGIMKEFSKSESDYARGCYNAAEKMMYNISNEVWVEEAKKSSVTSKSVFEKMIRNNKVPSQ